MDVQNDFADPAGALTVPGALDVLPVVNAAIEAADAAGALVAYTADWHPERTPHFATDGGPWPVHCVAGTWGAAFHPRLTVSGPVVRKGSNGEDGYSGFFMREPSTGATTRTELERLLRQAGISRVTLCGLATDYCVAATAGDALALGFDTSILVAGIRAVDLRPGDGERALVELAAAGVRLDRSSPGCAA
ncbi:MAG: isochorismatase family protein [Chloroflexi bacterium]|nr:isochorismatase family protein [Chloroflexota bacterium]